MKIIPRRAAALATAILLATSLAACSSGNNQPAATSPSTSSSELSGTLTVFAAASLQKTFTKLANQFEAANPKVKVSLSFDGSSTLVTQIIQGAPADVFASADQANMTKAVKAKMITGTPAIFATNVLEIAVPASNPANIAHFSDLAKPGVQVVVCAPQVPCGAAALADEKTAGITIKPVSQELNVTSVLTKVKSGQADAGLVYATDVKGAGDSVKGIPLDLVNATVNKYPIAEVAASKQQALAAAFIALVTGADGQTTLKDAGFGAP